MQAALQLLGTTVSKPKLNLQNIWLKVLQILVSTIENGSLGMATLLLSAQKGRLRCHAKAKLTKAENAIATCNQSEPISYTSKSDEWACIPVKAARSKSIGASLKAKYKDEWNSNRFTKLNQSRLGKMKMLYKYNVAILQHFSRWWGSFQIQSQYSSVSPSLTSKLRSQRSANPFWSRMLSGNQETAGTLTKRNPTVGHPTALGALGCEV